MTNHPNRSKTPREGRNPSPDEVREARAKAGLTQPEACKLIHVTLSSWKKYEAGDRRMPASAWELFNIKIDDRRRNQSEPISGQTE